MKKRRNLSVHLSPQTQNYLAWLSTWLKKERGTVIGIAIRRLFGWCMPEVFHTTWNTLVRALQDTEGDWSGLEERKEDMDIYLTPLRDNEGKEVPGWFEVKICDGSGNYVACHLNVKGRVARIVDWLPRELRSAALDREGLAVPFEVFGNIRPENFNEIFPETGGARGETDE